MRLNFGRFNPFTRRCRQSQRAKLGRNIPSTPLSWPNWNKTTWLAGGGIRGGKIIGATDEFGFRAVEDRIHVNDLHATILKLLGLEHEKLTFLFQGRKQRLTDVGGENEFAQRLLS